jgi:D-alanyl-D-alanine carboxypeptidase
MCICLALVGITAATQIGKTPAPQSGIGIDMDTDSDSASALDPAFLETDGVQTTKKPINPIPGLTAHAYLVGDIKTGTIYVERNSSKSLPVASMSKLVTAFVATDMMGPTTTIRIASSTLSAPPDTSNLQANESYSLEEILHPLLLSSSNVAAEAISLSKGNRARFMEMMSSYAWEVGMPSSFFADPSGVSPQNAASAKDLFELAKYLVNYRPDILTITRTPEMTLATTTEHGGHLVTSTHPFVNDPRFIGGKTGRTTLAGETMMTILDINGQQIVFIILGSSFGARENDTRILIREFEKKVTR